MYAGDFEPVFGRNIRYFRSLCGLTQEGLGVLVGTTGKNIRKIERAKGLISMDYRILMRLSEVFGVDTRSLARVDFASQSYPFPVYKDAGFAAVEEIFSTNGEKAIF